MSGGNNKAKIRRAMPDLKITPELERMAEKLDAMEALEDFLDSSNGKLLRAYVAEEIGKTIGLLITDGNDSRDEQIQRLRVQIGLFKSFSNAKKDTEVMRGLVDEEIDHVIASTANY